MLSELIGIVFVGLLIGVPGLLCIYCSRVPKPAGCRRVTIIPKVNDASIMVARGVTVTLTDAQVALLHMKPEAATALLLTGVLPDGVRVFTPGDARTFTPALRVRSVGVDGTPQWIDVTDLPRGAARLALRRDGNEALGGDELRSFVGDTDGSRLPHSLDAMFSDAEKSVLRDDDYCFVGGPFVAPPGLPDGIFDSGCGPMISFGTSEPLSRPNEL